MESIIHYNTKHRWFVPHHDKQETLQNLNLTIIGVIKTNKHSSLVMLRNEAPDYSTKEIVAFSDDTCTVLSSITKRTSE